MGVRSDSALDDWMCDIKARLDDITKPDQDERTYRWLRLKNEPSCGAPQLAPGWCMLEWLTLVTSSTVLLFSIVLCVKWLR